MYWYFGDYGANTYRLVTPAGEPVASVTPSTEHRGMWAMWLRYRDPIHYYYTREEAMLHAEALVALEGLI